MGYLAPMGEVITVPSCYWVSLVFIPFRISSSGTAPTMVTTSVIAMSTLLSCRWVSLVYIPFRITSSGSSPIMVFTSDIFPPAHSTAMGHQPGPSFRASSILLTSINLRTLFLSFSILAFSFPTIISFFCYWLGMPPGIY